MLDQVCLPLSGVRDPERRQVPRLRVVPLVGLVPVLVVGLVAGGGLYEDRVRGLAIEGLTELDQFRPSAILSGFGSVSDRPQIRRILVTA